MTAPHSAPDGDGEARGCHCPGRGTMAHVRGCPQHPEYGRDTAPPTEPTRRCAVHDTAPCPRWCVGSWTTEPTRDQGANRAERLAQVECPGCGNPLAWHVHGQALAQAIAQAITEES